MYPPVCRAVATTPAPAPMVRQLSSNSSFLHMEFWEKSQEDRGGTLVITDQDVKSAVMRPSLPDILSRLFRCHSSYY